MTESAAFSQMKIEGHRKNVSFVEQDFEAPVQNPRVQEPKPILEQKRQLSKSPVKKSSQKVEVE